MSRLLLGVLFAAALALAVPAQGQPLTVQDLLTLKKLGYSDGEVVAHIAKLGARFTLNDQDLARLRAAGAGDELLRALTGGREVALQDVQRMLEAKEPVDAILAAIAASARKPGLSAEAALALNRQNAPAAVILALRNQPLGVQELRTLARSGAEPAHYRRLAAMLGFQKLPLAVEDGLALKQAGVPDDVIANLRQAGAAVPPKPETPQPEDQAKPPKEKDKDKDKEPPPVDLTGTWSGTLITPVGRNVVKLVLSADATYTLTTVGVLQTGRWSVVQTTLVMTPDAGVQEADPFELKDGTLTVRGRATTLVLTRQP